MTAVAAGAVEEVNAAAGEALVVVVVVVVVAVVVVVVVHLRDGSAQTIAGDATLR